MNASEMIKNEQQITETFSAIERKAQDAIDSLREYESDIQNYLADSIAALCDVDKQAMLSGCNTIHVAQARWLYWYAYRYMNGDTYEKIAERTTKFYGTRFTKQGVASSVNKIATLIDKETVWTKRWMLVKRLIRIKNDDVVANKEHVVTICIPRELKEQIKIEIKEV